MVKNIKNVSKLRFILQQPSPYWKDFGIDEISIKLLNPVRIFTISQIYEAKNLIEN